MAPREPGKEGEVSVAGTTRSEPDEHGDARRRTPSGMGPGGRPAASGPLNDATTSPCGPFLAVHPAWTHRGALEYLDRLLAKKAGANAPAFFAVKKLTSV